VTGGVCPRKWGGTTKRITGIIFSGREKQPWGPASAEPPRHLVPTKCDESGAAAGKATERREDERRKFPASEGKTDARRNHLGADRSGRGNAAGKTDSRAGETGPMGGTRIYVGFNSLSRTQRQQGKKTPPGYRLPASKGKSRGSRRLALSRKEQAHIS